MSQKVEDHPFFGMEKNTAVPVNQYMKLLRGQRYKYDQKTKTVIRADEQFMKETHRAASQNAKS